MSRRPRVLFLCTGNSCRSQMAEGWTRALHGDAIEACSAGIEARGVDARAARVMQEAGAPIDGQASRTLSRLDSLEFDLVVTVCDHAAQSCPAFPGTTPVVHVPFDDPPRLANEIEDEALKLEPYRRVRDEIRAFIEQLPGRIAAASRAQRPAGNSADSSNGR
ncbi:MAG: arsenate reductase ArsC [bacterium]|nr:arsenate reductase ArsC [bacterium]